MGIFDFLKQPDIHDGLQEFEKTPGAVLLDVRTSQEYREGHIPGSKNVPLQEFEKVDSVAEKKIRCCMCTADPVPEAARPSVYSSIWDIPMFIISAA